MKGRTGWRQEHGGGVACYVAETGWRQEHGGGVACYVAETGWRQEHGGGVACYVAETGWRQEHGGGVACYVAEIAVYDRLHDIEDDEHEVLWISLKPKKILVYYYHPPGADNGWLREYLITSLDTVL